MRNPDYQPARPAIPPKIDPDTGRPVADEDGQADEGIPADPGSDYDLPVGWSFAHICNFCHGATRIQDPEPADDAVLECYPGCKENTARAQGAASLALPQLEVPSNDPPLAGAT